MPSFRSSSGGRPPQYRTPSPPCEAVEALSPIAEGFSFFRHSNGDKSHPSAELQPSQFPASHASQKKVQTSSAGTNGSSKSLSHEQTSAKARASAHTRTGSNIDTLATIALATSPTFSNQNFDDDEPSSPPFDSAANLSENNKVEQRPPKRARSEKLPSPEWDRAGPRPATSYMSEDMRLEAELLLNFARRPSTFDPNSETGNTPRRQSDETNDSSFASKAALDSALRAGINGGSFNIPHFGDGLAHSRSMSDGAAAMSRPLSLEAALSSNFARPAMAAPTFSPPTTHAGLGISHSEAKTKPPNGPTVQEKVEVQSMDLDTDGSDSVPAKKALSDNATSRPQPQSVCAGCSNSKIMVQGEDQTASNSWISCNGCDKWYHYACAGFKDEREVRSIDKFYCETCTPTHGPTTFVRKSSRARTAIDYAGLNEGVVKSSTETPEHHYIGPIKEGKIKFLPEKFPRMRAEHVTAEYFQRGIGMTEPVVIPAKWNPKVAADDDEFSAAQTDEVLEPEEDCPKTPLKNGSSTNGNSAEDEEVEKLIAELTTKPSWEDVIDCGQDTLDMVIPEDLTVRKVCELYGPEEHVEVIDVKSQQGEDKRWNMQKWTDYYESTDEKVVRNVISLEVSQSRLGRLLRRPKIVRDLDLQDAVWPKELQAAGDFPKVQFYCLMSVADCYTDFHIDFGGSSVFYHILKGKKTFFFIPPESRYLKQYEQWCMSPNQDSIFLGDQTKECYRVDLSEGDTMLIPSGWIHAVWTPSNSLVIGGNFLTRMNYEMQIRVAQIEKDTKVARKFRYPYFQKILWYACHQYLDQDPIPDNVMLQFLADGDYRFRREYPIYYEYDNLANQEAPGSEYYNARFYSQAELEGLKDLARYLLRTALIATGQLTDGITVETRNAVRRSIPKSKEHSDPVEAAQQFAIWLAWKRGNEEAFPWARSECIEAEIQKRDVSEKKPSARALKRMERVAAYEAYKQNPERHSSRLTAQAEQAQPQPVDDKMQIDKEFAEPPVPPTTTQPPTPLFETAVKQTPKQRSSPKTSGLGPKRVACDACRRRRIRCRHKDENLDSPTSKALAADAVRLASEALGDLANGNGFGPIDPALTGHPERMDGMEPPATPYQEIAHRATELLSGISSSNKKGRTKACDECRKSKVCYENFGIQVRQLTIAAPMHS